MPRAYEENYFCSYSAPSIRRYRERSRDGLNLNFLEIRTGCNNLQRHCPEVLYTIPYDDETLEVHIGYCDGI